MEAPSVSNDATQGLSRSLQRFFNLQLVGPSPAHARPGNIMLCVNGLSRSYCVFDKMANRAQLL